MDTTTKILIGAAGVAVASYAGTQLMIRFPGARAWLEKQLIEAYAYLDKHKDEVPEEGQGVWKAAYAFCDSTLQAISDGTLSWAESRKAGLQIIVLVNEVRKIVKV